MYFNPFAPQTFVETAHVKPCPMDHNFCDLFRVVKSSRLLAKIATYLVSIGRLLCLAFLYRCCFSNKISMDWPLTLTTQPSTSKLSDSPAFLQVSHLEVIAFDSTWNLKLIFTNCIQSLGSCCLYLVLPENGLTCFTLFYKISSSKSMVNFIESL